MFFVYFLLLNNSKIYTGSTNSLKDRIARHNKGEVFFTKNYLPVKLISFIAVPNKYTAFNLEKYFKSGSGRAFRKIPCGRDRRVFYSPDSTLPPSNSFLIAARFDTDILNFCIRVPDFNCEPANIDCCNKLISFLTDMYECDIVPMSKYLPYGGFLKRIGPAHLLTMWGNRAQTARFFKPQLKYSSL